MVIPSLELLSPTFSISSIAVTSIQNLPQSFFINDLAPWHLMFFHHLVLSCLLFANSHTTPFFVAQVVPRHLLTLFFAVASQIVSSLVVYADVFLFFLFLCQSTSPGRVLLSFSSSPSKDCAHSSLPTQNRSFLCFWGPSLVVYSDSSPRQPMVCRRYPLTIFL